MSRLPRSLKLRIWLPFTVFLLFSILSGLVVYYQYQWLQRTETQNGKDFVAREIAHVQHLVDYLIENAGDRDPLADAETMVSLMAAIPEVRFFVMLDDQGRILLSQHYAWNGRRAEDLIAEFDSRLFQRVRDAFGSQRVTVKAGDGSERAIAAYYPFRLPTQSGELRPTRVGVLFMYYDLSLRHGMLAHALKDGMFLWIADLLLMLALIYLLGRLVNEPTRRLTEAARRLSRGDYATRLKPVGGGEFAELADTFNDMADRLEKGHISLLRQKNLYGMLSATNEMILRATAEDELFDHLCQIAVNYEGIRLAWVGRPADDGRTIEILASAAADGTEPLRRQPVPVPQHPDRESPLQRLLRSHRHAVINDISDDGQSLPARDMADALGIRSGALFPVVRHNRIEQVLGLHGDTVGFFAPDIVGLLDEMVENIAFALDALENQRLRRAAEEALREREENLSLTLNSIGDAVIAADRRGMVVRMNPVAESLTGWPLHEAIGRPLTDVFRIIDVHRRGRIESPVDRVLRAAAEVGPMNHTALIARDGTERQIADSVAPIRDRSGQIVGVILVFHDVTEEHRLQTELRRSAMLLRHHIDNTPLAAIVWGIDGRVEQWNHAAERIFGYQAEHATGRLATELIVPSHRLAGHRGIHALLEDDDRQRVSENLTGDGRLIVCEWHHTPLRDETGALIGVASLAQDITERRLVDTLLQDVARKTSGLTGEAFFKSLVQQLTQTLQPALAHAAVLCDDPSFAEHIAISSRGELLANFCFAMAGTPAERVVRDGAHLAPMGLEALFPDSEAVRDLALQSYAGVALRDGSGATIGVLAVADARPMAHADTVLSLLNIFAVRCSAELQRMKVERELRLAATAFQTHEAILISDHAGKIIRVNRAFTEITGYGSDEVIGQTPEIFDAGVHSAQFFETLWSELKARNTWQGEIWSKRKNDEIFPLIASITAVPDDSGKLVHYVAAFLDISEQKKAEAEIQRLAYYDTLTNLPNRRLLMDRLQKEVHSSLRHHTHGAVLFLDLDQFKTINDALGHAVGDQLLIQVADRLGGVLRLEDTVARLGGDEFVVLLPDLSDEAGSAAKLAFGVAEKIKDAIEAVYDLHGREHHTSTSIGITLYPQESADPSELLKQADAAMYRAKAAGRNDIRYYRPDMQAAADARLALEKDLRHALSHDEFELYFQPQFGERHEPVGAEALIRWHHPQRGMVSPAEFIPVAEDAGLIIPIGQWVLRRACQDFKDWIDAGRIPPQMDISVNVSPKQFYQSNFVAQLREILRDSGLSPDRLMLELTEGVVIEHIAETTEKMRELKSLGIQFSIDDFGTGYSSLSYLKQLPIDQLKIDQSFVRDMANDANDRVIVQTIIGMARNLGLGVIAEGVETDDQIRFLKRHDCRAFQGYYFSRPVAGTDFVRLLDASAWKPEPLADSAC